MDNNNDNCNSFDKNKMSTCEQRPRQKCESDKENSEGIICKCDNGTCGKSLFSPYYISLGIPSNPYRRFTRECTSLQDEKNQERSIVFQIQSDLTKFSKTQTRDQSLLSTKNIMRSKRRICADCREEEKYEENIGILYGNHLRMAPIVFAVEEYSRRHPIDSITSQVEKYLVSLPDRSNMLSDYFGGNYMDHKDTGVELAIFEGTIFDYLTIALVSDYDASKFTRPPEHYKLKLHELRTKFIKDSNRTSPNDQELTRWMQENINNGYQDHWFKIQYSKVFENPKKERITIKNIIEEIRTTKYTVVIHFSSPNGYWLEYDI